MSLVTQEIFKLTNNWIDLPDYKIKPESEYHSMRGMQPRSYKELFNQQYRLLISPCGSGKTYSILYLTAGEFIVKPTKTIIAVPQTLIANGYLSAKLLLPNNKKVDWHILNKLNLCSDNKVVQEANTKTIIDFLKAPCVPDILSANVVICTHQLLAFLYAKLQKKKQLSILSNKNIWIDEAHHLSGTECENGLKYFNKIGHFVQYCIRNKTVNIGLTTATPFRGDKTSLLPSLDKFTTFKQPLDEHLKTMKYLKTFTFRFILCDTDMYKGIKEVFKKSLKKKTIIYIPPVITKYLSGTKYEQVERIIDTISKVFGKGKEVKITENKGLYTLKNSKGKKLTIIDLVEESHREYKKAYMGKYSKSKNGPDVVISLNLFIEGVDYVPLERAIVMGPRDSITDMIQRFGRLIRDWKGKTKAELYLLLPFRVDENKFEDDLNTYLKSLYLSMLMEEIYSPTILKGIPKKNKTNKPSIRKLTIFEEKFTETEQLEILEKSFDKLIKTRDKVDLYKEFKTEILPDLIKKKQLNEKEHSNLTDLVWKILTRRTLDIQGLDVDKISFNIIKKANPLGFLLHYTSGACGIKTLENLRNVLNCRVPYLSYEETIAYNKKHNIDSRIKYNNISDETKRMEGLVNNPRYSYKEYKHYIFYNRRNPEDIKNIIKEKRKKRLEERYEHHRIINRLLGIKSNKQYNDIPSRIKKKYRLVNHPLFFFRELFNRKTFYRKTIIKKLSYKEHKDWCKKEGIKNIKQYNDIPKEVKEKEKLHSNLYRAFKNKFDGNTFFHTRKK